MRVPQTIAVPTVLAAGLLAGCSGGGGSSSGVASLDQFDLVSISVPEGAVWQINRAIEFVFTVPVDFDTVGPNTINIQRTNGAPANGVFSVKRIDTDGDGVKETQVPTTVVFQPTCPTKADLSDAGLLPGGNDYVLTVIGRTSNAVDTVRSVNGQRLENTQTRTFRTPISLDSATVFLDPVPGPPQPVIRDVGSTVTQGVSYYEIGGDASNRVFFEFDPQTQNFSFSEQGFTSPLNLYSDRATKIAAVLVFNQPVSPLASNINSNFVRLEFLDGNGVWQPIVTTVRLVANCTTSGATVRLDPVGILPVASMVRAVINPGFRDLTAQEDNPIALTDFAVAPTERVAFTSLTPADVEGDEFFEGFDFGGEVAGSFEDLDAIFDTPEADWGGGALTAGFTFDGTGGPNGTFDWVIRDGERFFLNTVSDQIIGGVNGAPETVVNVVGGVVDVRDLIIEEGGLLSVEGVNPLCINASRDVIIRGTLDISGRMGRNVNSLNTGNQPEIGGIGIGGGGNGGTASMVTNDSTPKGQDGFGPFGEPGSGGAGGESGFNSNNTMNVNNRRPGGGGGGRLAPDVEDSIYGPDPDAMTITVASNSPEVFGMRAQKGFDGAAGAMSAIDPTHRPFGGAAGTGPFTDGDEDNNFWGTRALIDASTMQTVFIRGELLGLTAGYGGGAGGDASFAAEFPTPDWKIGSDEKGGPGGGGAGGLHIKALGDIVFGELGQIVCQGGQGGTGENTNFLDHVGGGGGGGSGGHVVLETASKIDFTDGDPFGVAFGTNPFLMEDGEPYDGGRPRILANGGDGATIGANSPGNGATSPAALGYGGDGGPGVVQLHVPNPTLPIGTGISAPTDIVVPLETTLTSNTLPPEDRLRSIMAPGGIPMIPTFGARSRVRSKWITLGAADQAEDGSQKDVSFYFGGTDPSDGSVLASNDQVEPLPDLLNELITGNGNVSVNSAGDTLTISGSSLDPLINDASELSNDIYLRTPSLLENFALILSDDNNSAAVRTFDVVAASYDDASRTLVLMVDVGTLGNTIQQFIAQNGGPIRYALVPRFFRILTAGVENLLSDDASVKITFQATGADAFGDPDESNILVDFTPDITEFNDVPAGQIQFVRFEVEFDLAVGNAELTTETDPVQIDFLRIPFRF